MSVSILVVDDDHSTRTAVCEWARNSGYVAVAAESGEQALEIVDRSPVNLVIADLRLPGMDGISLAEKLLEQDPDRPVLLITAYGNLDNAQRALSAGIYEYFTKPFSFKDLRAGVTRALEHRRLVLENQAYQKDLEKQKEGRVAELRAANQRPQREIDERKQAEQALREREGHLRDLFDNANDLIQCVGPDGRFLYVNRRWREVLGYAETDVQELHLVDIIRRDQRAHCMALFERVRAGESFTNVEAVFVARDGREVAVEGNVNGRFVDGCFVGTRGIFRDITQRRNAEQALKESEERIRLITDNIPGLISYVDKNMTYRFVIDVMDMGLSSIEHSFLLASKYQRKRKLPNLNGYRLLYPSLYQVFLGSSPLPQAPIRNGVNTIYHD